MFDGIETVRAAVNENQLIRLLNISMPYSPTFGDVREDLPLFRCVYKGTHILGVPSSQISFNGDRYLFRSRGSLIKVANNGLHNSDFKGPVETLLAMDDLVVNLRINPFKTLLNGLELSATVQSEATKLICSSIVSYLNYAPRIKTIKRDNLKLPYVEVEASQHKLKLYAPQPGSFRYELKIDQMQYLGKQSPKTFADVPDPQYVPMLVKKFLDGFGKVIWKYADMDLSCLTREERDWYLIGRDPQYWQIKRNDYKSSADFKRVEQERRRQKKDYKELVERHWRTESPAQIERRIIDQLDHYQEVMHTPTYKNIYEMCLNRWTYIANFPLSVRLPKRLMWSHLSEIYPLLKNSRPVRFFNSQPLSVRQKIIAREQTNNSQRTIELFPALIDASTVQQTQLKPAKDRRNLVKLLLVNDLRRRQKQLTVVGGLNYSLEELEPNLSMMTRVGLILSGQSLVDLTHSGNDPLQHHFLSL